MQQRRNKQNIQTGINRQVPRQNVQTKCRICQKNVPKSNFIMHQTNCMIQQQNQYAQQVRQQMNNFTYSSSSSSEEEDEYEVNFEQPDYNFNCKEVFQKLEFFGPNSQFQRSMNNMMHQMNNAFNINVNINNFNIDVQMSNFNGNFGIQIFQDDSDDENEEEYVEEQYVPPPPPPKRGMKKSEIAQIPTYSIRKIGGRCVVCMNDYKIGDKYKIFPCEHKFHEKCIDQWLKQKAECPMCRTEL